MIGTMAIAALLDWTVLKPLRRADEITIAIATIGLSIFLANTAQVLWGPIPHQIPSPFSSDGLLLFGSIYVTRLQLFSALITLALITVMQFTLRMTNLGRQIRAVVQDRDATVLVGLHVDRIYRSAFVIGCGLAATAGGLVGTMFLVYPTMGLTAVLKAFAVVIIGGMGSLNGSIVGGLLLGLAEGIGGAWLPSGYQDIVGFIMIIAILAFRPQGLLGAKQIRIR